MSDSECYSSILVKLAEIETKQDGLIKQFTNHLRHHWAVTIVLLGISITSMIGLVTFIFRFSPPQ